MSILDTEFLKKISVLSLEEKLKYVTNFDSKIVFSDFNNVDNYLKIYGELYEKLEKPICMFDMIENINFFDNERMLKLFCIIKENTKK